MGSSQLFSSILSNPLSKLTLDLSEIEREEKEIQSKIAETRKELEYVDNLVRKYEQIRYSLASKLTLLESQKDNYNIKRSKLVEQMSGGVQKNGGIESNGKETPTPIGAGTGNGSNGTPALQEKTGVIGSHRVSTTLTDDSPLSSLGLCSLRKTKLDTESIESRVFIEDVKKFDDDDENSLPMDLVAGLLKTLNEGSQSYNLTELADDSNDIDLCLPTEYSNGSATNGNGTSIATTKTTTAGNSISSLQPESNGGLKFSAETEPISEHSFLTKCFSSVVINSNNNSTSKTSDLQEQARAVGNNHNNNNSNSKMLSSLFGSGSVEPGTPTQSTSNLDQDEDWMVSLSPTQTSSVSSQAPRFFSKNHSHHQQPQQQQQLVQHSHSGLSKGQHNSVLALEASMTGYVYKSLSDGTVMRYRFANSSDNRYYRGHSDKVKVLFFDSKLQMLYTGCDDGKVRCFNANTGSLLNEFLCDGNVITIEKTSDGHLIFATNKGWIYYLSNHFVLQASHRTFNWIFAVKQLGPNCCSTDKKTVVNGSTASASGALKRLLVIPMKHKLTIIDTLTGKSLQEVSGDIIESRPCVQVNGNICILATVLDKGEPGKSTISVYDASNNWKCVQTLSKEGIISSLCTKGNDLYVGIKFPSYGHIQCFKWSSRILTLKWVACVAYVHTLAVMPSDIVLNGGPDGNVYNTTPNLKGPFLCTHKRCNCKLPFARRKDLEFHYSKLPTS